MERTLDKRFMSLALSLAEKARWTASPNPAVGALIVKGKRVIASGYHKRAGNPHAEIEALRQAGPHARGATLYVTLEPCNHFGRTPPCCDAIISCGVSRVVIASKDPNPITNGRGITRLKREGVRVALGVMQKEAQALNEPFQKAMVEKLPFTIAKIGQSLDGKIATTKGESRWITSEPSRALARRWRARVDAIVVGIDTVLHDDPLLSARVLRTRKGYPVKVIVDSKLRTPKSALCISQRSAAPTIIATTSRARAKRILLERRGAQVLVFNPVGGRVPLRALFKALVGRGIQSVLIEGGGELIAGALQERLVDRILFFIAPMLIGGRNAPCSVGGRGAISLSGAIRLSDVKIRRVGSDLCVEARVLYPKR